MINRVPNSHVSLRAVSLIRGPKIKMEAFITSMMKSNLPVVETTGKSSVIPEKNLEISSSSFKPSVNE